MIFYCMNSNELSLGIHRFLRHFSLKKIISLFQLKLKMILHYVWIIINSSSRFFVCLWYFKTSHHSHVYNLFGSTSTNECTGYLLRLAPWPRPPELKRVAVSDSCRLLSSSCCLQVVETKNKSLECRARNKSLYLIRESL